MFKDEIGNLWIKWIICVEAAIINNMFSLAIYNQYPPECESIHILLNHHPCIHFHWPVSSQFHRQVLGINVVQQLSGVSQMEDVKIMQILINQFTKRWFTWKMNKIYKKKSSSIFYKSCVIVVIIPWIVLKGLWKTDNSINDASPTSNSI